MRKLFLVLTILFSLSARAADPLEPISGTFIQFQDWMLTMDQKIWDSELDGAREIGIDTIVLQWVKYDRHRFYPANAPGNDPTEYILKYADKHKMKVFVGTTFDSAWWKEWDDNEYLAKTARMNNVFAKKLWDRYGKHASFAGWYLPQELSDQDFDDEEIAQFRTFFSSMSTACKRLSNNLPVMMSAFFARKVPVASVEKIYSKFLPGIGIDILAIQDGVGANNWEAGVENLAGPYLRGLVRTAWRSQVKPWVTIEVFTTTKDNAGKATGRAPATPEQIREQLLVSGPLSDKLLMFDFFHYMSPKRGEPHKLLYEWYRQNLK